MRVHASCVFWALHPPPFAVVAVAVRVAVDAAVAAVVVVVDAVSAVAIAVVVAAADVVAVADAVAVVFVRVCAVSADAVSADRRCCCRLCRWPPARVSRRLTSGVSSSRRSSCWKTRLAE
jgi:hypothetical protein